MSINPEKMLQKCKNGQWNIGDFDWSKTPEVTLDQETEMRICQLYLDMSYIERIAGNLFLALSDLMDDPVLKEIYYYCYIDEVRHSEAVAKLADYFDVHQYKIYTPSFALLRFIPRFSKAIRSVNPAVANFYVLTGELILDIALLKKINEYVDDPMSQAVVQKINADESRHIAMDIFMTEHCSTHDMNTDTTMSDKFKSIVTIAELMIYGPQFALDLFFRPMQMLDPTQKELEAVMRRLRRLYTKEEIKHNPTVKPFNQTLAFFDGKYGSKLGAGFRRAGQGVTGINFDWMLAGSPTQAGKNSLKEGTADFSAIELAEEILEDA
ncbi:MAG: hypothetical protein JKY67_13680 [Pseudomonadales bacterium]|nr:hypothetical protein [Pseudomonadales bacterium]